MPQPDRYVRVKVECSDQHLHDVCVEVDRQVPPELRCAPNEGPGYTSGGSGGGCRIPASDELRARAAQELRDALQESKRRGYVLVRA